MTPTHTDLTLLRAALDLTSTLDLRSALTGLLPSSCR